MSPKLPSLTAKEVIKLAEAQGFRKIRQKGSHVRYAHSDGRTTVIPLHSGKTLGKGLLLQILSDIGVDPADIKN